MKTYKDLEIYQEGYKLALEMYKITRTFPKEETYEMVSQLRRASTSIAMNIAEGYGRMSNSEMGRFTKMAIGGCNEIKVTLEMSKDLEYLKETTYQELIERYEVLGKRLYKFLQSLNQVKD